MQIYDIHVFPATFAEMISFWRPRLSSASSRRFDWLFHLLLQVWCFSCCQTDDSP